MDDNTRNIVVIGDRVLIRPIEESNMTGGGLYLPPSVKEGNAVHTGIVVKTGPGYPIPAQQDPDQFLHEAQESANFVPLQVREGDQALYLHRMGNELEINGEPYVVVPQNAILLVFREDLAAELADI